MSRFNAGFMWSLFSIFIHFCMCVSLSCLVHVPLSSFVSVSLLLSPSLPFPFLLFHSFSLSFILPLSLSFFLSLFLSLLFTFSLFPFSCFCFPHKTTLLLSSPKSFSSLFLLLPLFSPFLCSSCDSNQRLVYSGTGLIETGSGWNPDNWNKTTKTIFFLRNTKRSPTQTRHNRNESAARKQGRLSVSKLRTWESWYG